MPFYQIGCNDYVHDFSVINSRYARFDTKHGQLELTVVDREGFIHAPLDVTEPQLNEWELRNQRNKSYKRYAITSRMVLFSTDSETEETKVYDIIEPGLMVQITDHSITRELIDKVVANYSKEGDVGKNWASPYNRFSNHYGGFFSRLVGSGRKVISPHPQKHRRTTFAALTGIGSLTSTSHVLTAHFMDDVKSDKSLDDSPVTIAIGDSDHGGLRGWLDTIDSIIFHIARLEDLDDVLPTLPEHCGIQLVTRKPGEKLHYGKFHQLADYLQAKADLDAVIGSVKDDKVTVLVNVIGRVSSGPTRRKNTPSIWMISFADLSDRLFDVNFTKISIKDTYKSGDVPLSDYVTKLEKKAPADITFAEHNVIFTEDDRYPVYSQTFNCHPAFDYSRVHTVARSEAGVSDEEYRKASRGMVIFGDLDEGLATNFTDEDKAEIEKIAELMEQADGDEEIKSQFLEIQGKSMTDMAEINRKVGKRLQHISDIRLRQIILLDDSRIYPAPEEKGDPDPK